LAGIYIHIPFCKQACTYCDFHFSTSLSNKANFIDALKKEIFQRKNYLNEPIETIYFGGGTPSLLSEKELYSIIDLLDKTFELVDDIEITLEANPDDLNGDKIKSLALSPINRLSIGVQSFYQKHLDWMNRAHKVEEAIFSIEKSKNLGLDNISVDLIYGLPELSEKEWENNIQHIIDLDIQHVSCYCLTVEEKTAYHHQVKKGITPAPDDDESSNQFKTLTKTLAKNGFEHYEISNFAQPGFYSKHNTSYWQQKNYVGFGPSAHSFNQVSRQWNVSNNHQYILSVNSGKEYFDRENIDEVTRYNEYILTSFRTKWGVNKKYLAHHFNDELVSYFYRILNTKINSENINIFEDTIYLTDYAKLLADRIASDFFYV